jgi:hypothetical protein
MTPDYQLLSISAGCQMLASGSDGCLLALKLLAAKRLLVYQLIDDCWLRLVTVDN